MLSSFSLPGLLWAPSLPASRSEGLIQFVLMRLHAANHQILFSQMHNEDFQQGRVRRESEDPRSRRVVVDDATFDMRVFECKSDVMFGVAVFEGRRPNADDHHF